MSCASDLILSVPFARHVLGDLPFALYRPVMVCVSSLSLVHASFPSYVPFGSPLSVTELPSRVEDEEAHSRPTHARQQIS